MKVEKILDEVEKCMFLIKETMELNGNISQSSWITACHLIVAGMFRANGVSNEKYRQHLDETKNVTQRIWDYDLD